ncbi:MAG: hypothetical protein IPL50_20145 [Chitinophagaceae bacterium]|nr:hypothetical protein [Chitinophagaceae bacterium]
MVTAPSDHFRSVTPGGNWGDITTWETSPDNGVTPWIAATLDPTSAANTILIRNTANVTCIAAVTSGDQVTVEAGATLTLNGALF